MVKKALDFINVSDGMKKKEPQENTPPKKEKIMFRLKYLHMGLLVVFVDFCWNLLPLSSTH